MTDLQTRAEMEVFEYPQICVQNAETPPVPDAPANTSASESPAAVSQELLAEGLMRAHAEGVREGEQRAREQNAQALVQERDRIADALKKFETETATYYSRVEVEVVKLALAIASKILHREAQLDPLLVAALVRVTLDKFHKNTKALVRVRPEEASGWRQYFAQHMEQSSMPEVVEDSEVQAHSCLLETDLGSTELGLETQLKEIESGLFDLLAQRPEPK